MSKDCMFKKKIHKQRIKESKHNAKVRREKEQTNVGS